MAQAAVQCSAAGRRQGPPIAGRSRDARWPLGPIRAAAAAASPLGRGKASARALPDRRHSKPSCVVCVCVCGSILLACVCGRERPMPYPTILLWVRVYSREKVSHVHRLVSGAGSRQFRAHRRTPIRKQFRTVFPLVFPSRFRKRRSKTRRQSFRRSLVDRRVVNRSRGAK